MHHREKYIKQTQILKKIKQKSTIMIPRLTMDPFTVKNITPEQFEACRDYYTLQMSKQQGRRRALTSQEIKEDIVVGGKKKQLNKLFRRQCKKTPVQDSYNTPKNALCGQNNFKYEDREIYFILKANARGRRQSFASSICL